MAHQEALIRQISPDAAAQLLAGLEHLDPSGKWTAADLAAAVRSGACFAVQAGDGAAVYVVHARNGVCWVDAAKGESDVDLTEVLDQVITRQAQASGLTSIGMQTKRRGLVRKLERRGWRVTGWVMRKEL